MTIEDTTKRDPNRHLVGLVVEGSSSYIEGMERAGGKQMAESADMLPTEIERGTREDFIQLGFEYRGVDKKDPLFSHWTLPKGWKKKEGGHQYGYWTYIVDERGLDRVAIFYKAAYYDRRAAMSLVNVGGVAASNAIYDKTATIPWDKFTAAEKKDAIKVLRDMQANIRRNLGIYGEHKERVAELLKGMPK